MRFTTLICMRVWSCKEPSADYTDWAKFFDYNFARFKKWGGAIVVEWDSLENCCGLRSTEGSNPSLPAKVQPNRLGFFYPQ